jgi:hypothetical protein
VNQQNVMPRRDRAMTHQYEPRQPGFLHRRCERSEAIYPALRHWPGDDRGTTRRGRLPRRGLLAMTRGERRPATGSGEPPFTVVASAAKQSTPLPVIASFAEPEGRGERGNRRESWQSGVWSRQPRAERTSSATPLSELSTANCRLPSSGSIAASKTPSNDDLRQMTDLARARRGQLATTVACVHDPSLPAPHFRLRVRLSSPPCGSLRSPASPFPYRPERMAEPNSSLTG